MRLAAPKQEGLLSVLLYFNSRNCVICMGPFLRSYISNSSQCMQPHRVPRLATVLLSACARASCMLHFFFFSVRPCPCALIRGPSCADQIRLPTVIGPDSSLRKTITNSGPCGARVHAKASPWHGYTGQRMRYWSPTCLRVSPLFKRADLDLFDSCFFPWMRPS